MLARPEIGTREDILLWIAGKPADETFEWPPVEACARGQYADHAFGCSAAWRETYGMPAVNELDALAKRLAVSGCEPGVANPVSFDALYKAAREEWA